MINVQPLLRAVVESAAFAALGADQVVQPDAAVSHLEELGAILSELGPDERRVLLDFVQRMAEAEESETGRTARVEFLRTFGENLGLS